MKRLATIFLLCLMSSALFAQNIQVQGTVLDNEGYPQIGAGVFQKGTSNGTVTDLDGRYSLSVPADAVLVYSFQGFSDVEEAVNGRETIDVTMNLDSQFLEEVVVVGYGVQKSKDLTAPIVTVKGDALSKQAAANPMSALQGMVAGVQIIQSGAPGAGPSVKVRGVGSIGDYASPLYIVDGTFVDNIDFLSNNDIESLTVLKDASAAAIYGVRAANGVVLVTTKKGSHDHLSVSYDGYAGVQVPVNIMKLCNTEQYVELLNLANRNTIGWTDRNAADYPGSTDWYKELVHPAATTSHALDFSGASDKTNYSVGLSYLYQDGIMNHSNNDYNRINIRARLDQQMTSWLKVGINSVFSRYSKHNYNGNAFYQAFINPPVYNVYNESNEAAYPEKFDSPQLYGFGNAYGNPVAFAKYCDDSDKGFKEVLSAYAEFSILPSKLSFKISYNLDYSQWDQQNYTPESYVGGSQGTSVSVLSKTFGYGVNQILDNVLTYTDRKGRNDFSVMLGQSTRSQFSSWLNGRVNSVPDFDDQSKYLVNGSYKNQTATDGASRYNGLSFFARGTYNYDGRYLATLTFRADGSSKYQQKWGFFPSIGLGWNISDEAFMKNQNVVDYLKLRASWGMLGNDNVPANSIVTVGSTGVGSSAVFGDTLVDGMGAQTVYQNFLRWEVVNEANVGLDFGFLDNRLTGELDLYNRVTDNVVFEAPIATGGGTVNLLANNGKVLNQGIELSLNWADKAGEFSYKLGMNATFNRNRVLELEGRDYIPGASVAGNYATRTMVGYPIGAFWGYEIDGVYASEGQALRDPVSQTIKDAGYFKYKDQNGDNVINEEDKTYLGSAMPWMVLGINFGFNWKNLDFSILLNTQVGNKILNAKRMQRGTFTDANYDLDFYKNCWRDDNKSNVYPSPEAASTSFIQQANDFYVEDASFFRIQNVQLGYSFTGMKWAKSIRLYISAQRPLSLFRYNGFTTEIGGSPISSGIDSSVYPMQAIYTAGVNFNF
ncbi:MAG: TonB-dependent receptor [Candidatus Cryptobacteroides sp.]|nr:TonB-dependent receptor [Bacteroidales bacterium]MDD6152227.1 TonB-dependent receptor [Bacteroidales bacterium]MDD7532692.1 TonB-dependent receptor [Bacteroidales bacterium]MDY2858696.1 TonB-dependent receptor [Candidatus Cryptobacteroides sp.]MDY5744184.1 TonB-dependent receptor [Candidatus Cryptobacteroides sp.]